MGALYSLQAYILFGLGIAAFGMEVFALIDALRRDEKAFQYADKRTKSFWLIVLGVSAAVGFVNIFSVLSFIGIIPVIGAGIYLADVRPAISAYRPRSGSSGPYGSW